MHDCIVSEWGPWSPCPIDPDMESKEIDCDDEGDIKIDVDGDMSERRRVILHKPINGGEECPNFRSSYVNAGANISPTTKASCVAYT